MLFPNKKALITAVITESDTVLDVGFLGQGITAQDPNWPHALIKARAHEVYGLDLKLNGEYRNNPKYLEASAEIFSFQTRFDVIFAGDLIEHLTNPGLFLACCKSHLKEGGRLVLTTPNAFNLFNVTEKLTKYEPTVNSDHTFYFNSKTLSKLLQKSGMRVKEIDFLYTLGYTHKESWKKKVLNGIYWLLSRFTSKFIETLVIVAEVAPQ